MMKEGEKSINCRVCIDEVVVHSKYYNIFDSNEDFLNSDKSVSGILIADKLKACANVKITKGDGLSDRICSSCLLKLEDAFNFRRKCEKSDKILRAITKVCRDIYEDQHDSDIIQCVEDTTALQDNVIELNETIIKREDSESLENIDFNSQLVSVDVKVECLDEPDENYLSNENVTYVSNDNNIEPNSEILSNKLTCNIKNAVPDKQAHNKKCGERKAIKLKLECHDCGKLFKSKIQLAVHWKKKHKIIFTCSICKLQFKSHGRFIRHKKNRTKACINFSSIRVEGDGENLQYYCKQCEYNSTVRRCVLKHLVTHSTGRYKCELCNMMFPRLMSLRVHKERTHEVFTAEKTCRVCGMFFTGYSLYKAHISKHGEKKQCDICKKYFSNKSAIRKHMQTHITRSYICEMCAANFNTYHALEFHIKRCHNKKYMCKICKYKTAFKYVLKKHEAKHDNVNFGCKICGRLLESEDQLQIHLECHTNKQHNCRHCDKSFFKRKHYTFHLRKVHKIYISQNSKDIKELYKQRKVTRKGKKE